MHPLTALAHELTDKYHPCSMEIGKVLLHPDGRTVKILNGCFRDATYDRVSNWWTWQEVLPNGTLGEKESGYGW